MHDPQGPSYYKLLIDQAESYHDLVILRSRYFSLMDRSLPKEEALAVKDYWAAKARSENLPVAPPKKIDPA